jgi:hypothetical protein
VTAEDYKSEDVGRPGLRGLHLKPGYDSSDEVLQGFYVPALSRATSYARSVGYFRSSALSVAARGLSHFLNGGGTMRLLCGVEISAEDREALLGRATLDGAFAERLANGLTTESDVARRRLEVLAWLARTGRLEVRIAIAVDQSGAPIVGGGSEPYFHEKIGVLRDGAGDGVAFQGSVNESATGWTRNFESFSVYASWDQSAPHFSFWANKFEDHWSGRMSGFRVYELPQAVRERLLRLAPLSEPGERDPEEPPAPGDDAVVARFLQVAPRLVGAEGLAEATVGVSLFPHQRQVVARLANLYPRPWLVADEVGLGKTISAGMALRRLLLSGTVRRALVLAPANVCRQWQDELFEKFGLWVPRLDSSRIYGAHPSESERVLPGQNPYAAHPVLIASSHLARRREEQDRVLAAGPFDLVILDEAHHARRRRLDPDEYRPGRMLQLLDRIRDSGTARALWLLTATPMQLSALELHDLLCHVGLDGPLASYEAFTRYYRELAKDDLSRVDWNWLGHVVQRTSPLPKTAAEEAVLSAIRTEVGPVDAARIESFGIGRAGSEVVGELSAEVVPYLRDWLSATGPVARHLTRHSRATLQHYRSLGLITENLANRDVRPQLVSFSREERDLYRDLDGLIDRLLDAHGSRRGAGFVLTVYRRRLTSSWAAIRKTLSRRLLAETEVLALEEDLAEEAEAEDLEADDGIDDTQVLPLTPLDLEEIRGFLDRAANVADSKFDQLRRDIDEARSAGHSTIIFTQYTDTLEDLRDRLVPAYRSQLATFTGGGGRIFREAEGFVEIAKRDLVDAIRSRAVTVLLATDAASEGLNLQACSYLVNYDMPWNPMRVEQRIGRIDRLGQQSEVVHVRNYFVPGTVEEAVYAALAERLQDFRDLLGHLQPVLGATERTFQTIFRAPRAERAAVQQRAIGELLGEIDTLERGGIALDDEDAFPIPAPGPSPVSLSDLRELVLERFGAVLDDPLHPVTWDPTEASRDAVSWAALVTYGHPRLDDVLASTAARDLGATSALVIEDVDGFVAAVRADRLPPEPVRSVGDLDDLGAAAARGEAEAVARRIAAAAAQERRRYRETIATARARQQSDSVRAAFIALIREVIAAGCGTERDGAEQVGPVTVWYDLSRMRSGPWAYVEAFRKRLGVQLSELLPEPSAVVAAADGALRWEDCLSEAGRKFGDLIAAYQRDVR